MESNKIKEYPYPTQLMDDNGYPTQEALDYIKNWGYETIRDNDQVTELIFGKYFNQTDLTPLIEYIQCIWAYDDAVVYEDGLLELHTVGWSGNEEIISELKNTTLWWFRHRATRTGGHYYFKIDNNSEYDYDVVKIKQ